MISAATIEMLVKAGVQGDALIAIVRQIEADNAAPPRSANAERQARFRAKKRAGVVHAEDNVTCNVTNNVTGDADPSPLVPPFPPAPPNPPIIPPTNQSSSREVPVHVQTAQRLLAIGENYLAEWEWDFLIGIASFDRLTPDQSSKLDGIARKLDLAERITGPPSISETGEIIPLHKVRPNAPDQQKSTRSRNFDMLDAIVAEAERRENARGGNSG